MQDPRMKNTHKITRYVSHTASAESDCVVGEAGVVELALVEIDFPRITTSQVGLSMHMVASALVCVCMCE